MINFGVGLLFLYVLYNYVDVRCMYTVHVQLRYFFLVYSLFCLDPSFPFSPLFSSSLSSLPLSLSLSLSLSLPPSPSLPPSLPPSLSLYLSLSLLSSPLLSRCLLPPFSPTPLSPTPPPLPLLPSLFPSRMIPCPCCVWSWVTSCR